MSVSSTEPPVARRSVLLLGWFVTGASVTLLVLNFLVAVPIGMLGMAIAYSQRSRGELWVVLLAVNGLMATTAAVGVLTLLGVSQ